MESKEKGGAAVLRNRDLILLCVVAVAMYLSLSSASLSYTLDPSWYLDQRKYSTAASSEYRSVPPVVTDLDGDGSKEVIMITRDHQLKVFNAEAPNGDHREVFIPEELASVRLSSLNLQKGKTPVALKTGYVVPYSEDVERSQVIVVVLEDWSVICYDATLKVLWEKAVAHKTHELDTMIDKFRIDQVAVMIAPISIREGVSGVVVVGANMALREAHEDIRVEHESEQMHSGDEDHPEMHARASLEHFSLYALDASNGHVVWLHDGLEMKPEDFVKSLPMNALRLDRRDLQPQVHHAPGISDWTIFRQSLLAQLPHSWQSVANTALSLAHFERRHLGARSVSSGQARRSLGTKTGTRSGGIGLAGALGPSDSKGKAVAGAGAGAGKRPGVGETAASAKRDAGRLVSGHGRFTGIETPPLAASAVLPHDASEHTEHPNVLVAHTKNGLEVIALKSGLPMTSLALSPGRAYADVDGDGVVDTLIVLEKAADVQTHGYSLPAAGGHAGSGGLQHCSLMVLSGLPTQAQLFNGSLCANRNSLNDPAVTPSRYQGSRRTLPDRISATQPLVVRTVDPRTLMESRVRDVVVAINTGILTCFSGTGVFKWQLRNLPLWSLSEDEDVNAPFSGASLLHFDADATRVEEGGSHDSVHAHLLVTGESSLTLVSREGSILASADIPSPGPLTLPVLGDFDSDGVVDIIIVTEDSLLGYRVQVTTSSRGLFVALMVLSGIAAVAFVANIKVESVPLDPRDVTGSKKLRSVLSLARSTEEFHLD